MDEVEVKDCTCCKNFMPCKAKSKSEDLTLCAEFVDFYPKEDGMSLEDLQAMNASIPEDDPIEEVVTDYERSNYVDDKMIES